MSDAAKNAMKALTGPVSRRGFIGRCGAAPVAAAAAGGIATGALANAPIRTFKGKYAIDGHRVVDGFFAAPKGRIGLDVVLVIPANGSLDRASEATARSYAAQGWMAIVPNLPTTYRGAVLGGKPALVEAMMQDLPRLRKLGAGSGRVVVAA